MKEVREVVRSGGIISGSVAWLWVFFLLSDLIVRQFVGGSEIGIADSFLILCCCLASMAIASLAAIFCMAVTEAALLRPLTAISARIAVDGRRLR